MFISLFVKLCFSLGVILKFIIKLLILLLVPSVAPRKDENGRSCLLKAVQENNTQKARDLLLKEPRSLNEADNYGNRPLLQALRNGNLQIVDLLIKAKADLNVKDLQQDSPLLLAAAQAKHSADLVALLVSRDYEFDVAKPLGLAEILQKELDPCSSARTGLFTTKPESKLWKFCRQSMSWIFNFCQPNYKLNLNIQNIHGYTPLDLAIQQGNVRSAEILLKAGAKVDLQSYLAADCVISANLRKLLTRYSKSK